MSPSSHCPVCGHRGEGFRPDGERVVCPRCGESIGEREPRPVNVGGRTLAAGSALAIAGALTLAASLGWLALNFTIQPALPQPVPGQDPQAATAARIGMYFGMFAPPGVGIAIGLAGIVGGVQLARRRTWGLAVAGAFAAALPCTCGFPIGLPIGVWALLVLANPAVKGSFR